MPSHFRSRPAVVSSLAISAPRTDAGRLFPSPRHVLRTPQRRRPRRKSPKPQSVIHIFLPGGMAHQESFDPKPYAPIEYRGEIGTTKTKVEGVFFSEYLKQTAEIADKITVCRSMTHGEAAHERGTHNMFTGYRPSPALVFPSMGSIVSHQLGVRNNLPPYVCVPSQPTTFAGSGYLSSAYAPFSLKRRSGQRQLQRAGFDAARRC